MSRLLILAITAMLCSGCASPAPDVLTANPTTTQAATPTLRSQVILTPTAVRPAPSPPTPTAVLSPAAPPATPATRVLVDGVEMSLMLSAGPYFVSQLITVEVSLTNRSQATYELPNRLEAGPCGAALGVSVNGDEPPEYVLPNQTVHSCPPPLQSYSLNSGHSLTIRHLVPLTMRGNVTVTGVASFLTTTIVPGGGRQTRSIPGPLDGHWPARQIVVDPQVPPERRFSLERSGGRVLVHAPPELREQPVYLVNVSCHDVVGSAMTETGNYRWEPVQNGSLDLRGCAGKDPEWTVSVSAPGYAIVSARYR